jgi:cytidylate kinase
VGHGRPAVVNGDLGSGKTTVSVLLAQRLRVRRVSIGDLYRNLAPQRGVTAPYGGEDDPHTVARPVCAQIRSSVRPFRAAQARLSPLRGSALPTGALR